MLCAPIHDGLFAFYDVFQTPLYYYLLQESRNPILRDEAEIDEEAKHQTDECAQLDGEENVHVDRERGGDCLPPPGDGAFPVGFQLFVVHDRGYHPPLPRRYRIEEHVTRQRVAILRVHLLREIAPFDVSPGGHEILRRAPTGDVLRCRRPPYGVDQILRVYFRIVIQSDERSGVQRGGRPPPAGLPPRGRGGGAGRRRVAEDGGHLGQADAPRAAPGEEVEPEFTPGLLDEGVQ